MMAAMELKKMRCEFSYLSRSDGSAVFASGNSMVLASVHGPCEVKPQKLLIDKATIEVMYKPKTGLPNIGDKLKESMLANVCKVAILSSEYPRSLISIIIQEMQNDGTMLSCSINAACLALLDAGIPLKFLVAAVTCIINEDNNIILDPQEKDMENCKAVFTIVFDSIEKNIIASKTEGEFKIEEYDQIVKICQEASTCIFKFYRDIVGRAVDMVITR